MNREKSCAVYEDSGIKFQLLSVNSSVNSSTGEITASGTEKTVNNTGSSINAVSVAEGSGNRIVVLASEGTTLKSGSSSGEEVVFPCLTLHHLPYRGGE
ncbi:hypothetical protein [Neorickettsia helminthoeca]|uniref:hypothetical protein n=1 Tax=Neorickettsia helminthoeca TaxID=33994 RepID=UPI00056EA5DC|nr:hypothetical protein [Neorickettsia helminthoeca]